MGRYDEREHRASDALSEATWAYARLLTTAERAHSSQWRVASNFVAATYHPAYRFDMHQVKTLNVNLTDDAMKCLDYQRWDKLPLQLLVPEGEARVRKVIETWGIQPTTGAAFRAESPSKAPKAN